MWFCKIIRYLNKNNVILTADTELDYDQAIFGGWAKTFATLLGLIKITTLVWLHMNVSANNHIYKQIR